MKTQLHADLVEPNPPVGVLAGWRRIWTDFGRYRFLVANFILRDVRLKYRNSALGYLWSLLEPLLLSAVYYVLFVIVAGKADEAYALWVIIGVVCWGCFARSVNGGVTSLTANEGLIKQVFFPRSVFAIAKVGSQFLIASLSLFVTVPFMIYLGIAPTMSLWMVPVGLLMLATLALGLGLSMACLNVVNRDVQHFFAFLMRAGLYLSPVMWTAEMLPPGPGQYMLLNPMAVPITMIRNGITGVGLGIDSMYITYSAVFCIVILLVGTMVFQRYEATVVKKL